MCKVLACVLFLGVTVTRAVFGQISPGELSAAHAELEGMSHCTRCHAIGKTISNDKCLDCHQELKSRITANKGYHAKLSGHGCVECHKEHHGRSFSITRFNQTGYDHQQATGFALDGKHAGLACTSCHKTQFVQAADVRANQALQRHGTYLGLSTSCAACHNDAHHGQFTSECRTCHVTERWKPVPGFSHDNARFRLTGRHADVSCAGCHKPSSSDPAVVRFRGLAFERCIDCHTDPHRGKLQGTCESCHSTLGWRQAESKFNHATTRFPLRGLHARQQCVACHSGGGAKAGGRLLRFAKFQKCADCHTDPHNGQFTARQPQTGCERCHVEAGWSEGPMKNFNHGTTHFDLRGKHLSMKCMDCHGQRSGARTVQVDLAGYERCASCHVDPHAGQFARGTNPRDCSDCHQETGFVPATYTAAMHNTTRMALDGGHEAVPCVECHARNTVNGTRVQQFTRTTAPRCLDCHKDPHQGGLDRWMPACVACHVTASWTDIRFRHEQTRFSLDGKHVHLACAECHNVSHSTRGVEAWQFQNIPMKCEGCHGAATPSDSLLHLNGEPHR